VLVSIGGADTAVMVWAGEVKAYAGESDNSDTDDEEEGWLNHTANKVPSYNLCFFYFHNF